jgi:hypothetical protein
MPLETHGRWPLVGAAALAPVSAAAATSRPELRPLAALLWHQTEEWVWPGSFLPWINREVLGSREDEFPIDRRLGFIINVAFGWGFSLAAMAGPRGTAPVTAIYVSHLGNTALHLGWAARHRRYDPGAITAVATLTPVAVTGLRALAADPRVPKREFRAGIAAGIALSAALVPVLRWRMRRAEAR